MKKLYSLKKTLSSMGISEDQLSKIDLLIKLSAISAPDSKTRGERAKSFLFGDQEKDSPDEKGPIDSPKTTDAEQKEEDSSTKNENKNQEETKSQPDKSESKGADVTGDGNQVKINCNGKNNNIENIYNFSKHEFIGSCEAKKCLIRDILLEAGGNEELDSHIEFIDLCIENYRENLKNSEFETFTKKLLSSQYREIFSKIVIDISGEPSEVKEEDSILNDFKNTWLGDSAYQAKYLFFFQGMQKSYLTHHKSVFFNFCSKYLDEIILSTLDKKIKNVDNIKVKEKKIVAYNYNVNHKNVLKDCFVFKKFNLDFKNDPYFKNKEFEKYREQMQDAVNPNKEEDFKDKTELYKKYEKDLAEKEKEEVKEYSDKSIKDMRLLSNKSFSRKKMESMVSNSKNSMYYMDENNRVQVREGKRGSDEKPSYYQETLTKLKKEADQENVVNLTALPDYTYRFKPHAGLAALYILSKHNKVPIEFTQIQYIVSGFKDVKLDPSFRYKNVSQDQCVQEIESFFEEYKSDSIKNPYNFYINKLSKESFRSKLRNPPGSDNFSAKNSLNEIMKFHQKIDKAIYDFKIEKSKSGQINDLKDWFKHSGFVNINKILLDTVTEREIDDIIAIAQKLDFSLRWYYENSSNLYVNKQIYRYYDKNNKFYYKKEKPDEYKGQVKYLSQKEIESNPKYDGKIPESIIVDGKEYEISRKAIVNTGKYILKNYIIELNKLKDNLKVQNCSDTDSCSFDTNSALFSTICEAINGKGNIVAKEGSGQKIDDEHLITVINNLFYSHFINAIVSNSANYSTYSPQEGGLFYDLYNIAFQYSPNKNEIAEINKELRVSVYQKMEEEIEKIEEHTKSLELEYTLSIKDMSEEQIEASKNGELYKKLQKAKLERSYYRQQSDFDKSILDLFKPEDMESVGVRKVRSWRTVQLLGIANKEKIILETEPVVSDLLKECVRSLLKISETLD